MTPVMLHRKAKPMVSSYYKQLKHLIEDIEYLLTTTVLASLLILTKLQNYLKNIIW